MSTLRNTMVLMLGLLALTAWNATAADNVVITEFMAKNQSTLLDEDGSAEDWIEIFNAGTNTVNLLNWSLTDSAGNLTKWRFPSTNMAPGRFMIVWASNKNRRTAGAPLHTSFKLDPNPGEYLALVRADGTIATQFSPVYPPQAQDISYGFALTAVTNTLVGSNSAVKFLVPTNWNAAPFWTNTDYSDLTWSNATLPVGFDVDGTNVSWVLRADSMADFAGTQGMGGWYYGYYNRTADTNTPGYQTNDFIVFPNSGSAWSTSNYWTGSMWDYYGANPPWTYIANNNWHPNGTNNTTEHWPIRRWVARTNGLMRVDWTLAKQNVSCGNGVSGYIFHNGVQKDSATVAFNDAVGVNRSVTLTGVQVGDVIDFVLSPAGADNLPLDSCDGSYGQMTIYSGVALTNFIATDLKKAMWTNNASVYIRAPFTVSDPSQVQNLALRMRYDDGFVAYLNGVEVARRRAPSARAAGVVASSTNDWSTLGLQGNNGWYYGYYNQSADTNGAFAASYTYTTDFNTSDTLWFFSGTNWLLGADDPPNTMIGLTTWAPNGTNNLNNIWPVRRWVSPVSGVVTTRVTFAKAVSGGNGATLRVFVNGTQLTARTISSSDTIGFTTNMVLTSIDVGDTIDFALDPAGTDGQTSDLFDTCIFGAVMSVPSANDIDWNSAATGVATITESGSGVLIDISAYQPFLLAGTNLLAFQGLNVSASDGDFLLWPELLAVSLNVNTNSSVYFLQPTPGAANGSGTTNLGPLVLDVTHTPLEPATNVAVTVTAKLAVTFNPIGGLTLTYRVAFGAETNTPMFDDGLHGDGAAGDGVYGAFIPPNITTNGQMIRYYVTATDTLANKMRSPSFLTAESPQYYGLVPGASTIVSSNAVLHWFIQSPTAANTIAGTTGCVYYAGQFFDNIRMNLHGQSSSGFSTLKKSYNFDFNKGYKIELNPSYPKVSDFALITTWADRSYMRYMLADDDYHMAGVPAHYSFALRVQQNGSFFALYNLTETGDEEFLNRIGLDQNGALYKIYNTLYTVSGNEKKTRKWEPAYDLQALINGVTNTDVNARTTYVYDNLNLPNIVAFLAAKGPTSDHDCCHKNHYMYHDVDGSGEWYALPWDVDLTFGHVWTSTNGNYFDDTIYTNVSPYIGNGQSVFSVIYNDAVLKSMVARRLRTIMDEMLQPLGTPTNTETFRALVDYYATLVSGEAALDRAKWGLQSWVAPSPAVGGPTNLNSDFNTEITRIKDFYLPGRRYYLFVNQVTNSPQIPQAQPSNAVVLITSVDYSPASSNQAQEYIELYNTNNYAVDISGWKIKGGVDFTFAPGTVITATNKLYVSPDVKAFRSRTTGPRGGQRLIAVGPYSGQLSARGESLALITKVGATNATFVYTGAPSLAQQYLRITEIMYHPSPLTNGIYAQDDYEYIELKNISASVSLNLNGVKLTNGVVFNFSGSAVTNLGPGQKCLVVKSNAAFTFRYGAGLPVAGSYVGALDNNGERIQLLDASNEEILDFSYNNSWYPITDGLGFSLVVVNESAAPDEWNNKSNWRASGRFAGSPGSDDPAALTFAPIVVNEALTHTDLPQVDSIELYNPTATNVIIGGWFLTDDFNTPKKYRIPTGTTIPANGYVVFTETDFNTGPTAFALSSSGDQCYVFSGDSTTNLSGYFHGFAFDAIENGWTFGRYVNSQTNEDFVPQIANTLGAANAGPRIGPIVISELNYHPVALTSNDSPASYIELANIADTNVPLFTVTEPTNTWRLRKDADFDFPTNIVMAPGDTLLVVSFDPATNATALAAFRSRYGLGTSVPVYGPYSGSLKNDEGVVELQKPDFANSNSIPYVRMDHVHYRDTAPWPVLADGAGATLSRVVRGAYGNDPTNWVAAVPTPGTNYSSGTAPLITAQPQNVLGVLGSNATLSVTASGTAPLSYQWIQNGIWISSATNATLSFPTLQRTNAGTYSVLVMSPYGSVLSTSVTMVVQIPVSITAQPQSVGAFPGQNATFSVTAVGDTPFYQWRSNGVAIAGATNTTYARTNLQTNENATYTVLVTNTISSVVSSNATLTVLLRPSILQQPLSQMVFAMSNATFSVIATSSTPIRYQWFFTNAVVDSNVSLASYTALANATNSTYQILGAQDVNSGSYRVRVWDSYGTNLSDVAVLDVWTKPSVVEGPFPTNVVALTGGNASFTLRVRGGLPINYRWRKNGLTTLTNMFITDTNSTYALNAITHANAGYYDVALTNLYGSTTPGSRAYLTVMDPLTNQVVRPNTNVAWNILISTFQPTNTGAANTNLWVKYYWFLNGTNLVGSGAATSTVVSASLSITNIQTTNEGIYTLFATNLVGMVAVQTASLAIAKAPLITAQPTNITTLAGSAVSFAVSVSGAPAPTFQWQKNGTDIPGPNAAVLPFGSVQLSDAGSYRVIAANSEGSVTSQVATLTVLVPPFISTQPSNQIAMAGSAVQFDVVGGGAPAPSYQWFFGTNALSFGTNTSLILSNVTPGDAGNYSVVLSNTAGSVTSAVATLAVAVPPSIVQQPTNVTVSPGTQVSFTVVAQGSAPLAYQWWFNGTNSLAGATDATLTLPAAQRADAGSYHVLVANSAGVATSAVAVLTVNRPPAPLNDGFTIQRNTALTITNAALLANDSDPDGDVVTFFSLVGSSSTNGGSVSYSAGLVTYSPAPNFVGLDRFTYSVADPLGAQASADVQVYVIADAPPQPNSLTLTTTTNGFLVRFAGNPGDTYYVQRSEDLQSWTIVQTQVAPQWGIIEFSDSSAPPAAAFYRIRKQAP